MTISIAMAILSLTGAAAAGARAASPVTDPTNTVRRLNLVPNGITGQVYALAVDGPNVYLGGTFYAAGDAAAANVVKWDGNNWSALGNGLDGPVYALAWDSSNKVLYAGGSFAYACTSPDCRSVGVRLNHIAQWNGTSWSGLGNGVYGDVYALALDGDDGLYVGGNFTNVCIAQDCTSGTAANNIIRWSRTNQAWSQLVMWSVNIGVSGAVRALAWDGAPRNVLYAGGDFVDAGSITVNRVARWDPNAGTWVRLNYGVNGIVRALAWDTTGGYLYAGGDFVNACANANCSRTTPANYIGRWNGITWTTLDGGVSGPVYSLVLDSNRSVYMGGDFSTAGSVVASRIAKWSLTVSSSSWSALGSGAGNRVTALAVSGNDLFAAGSFPLAGGAGAAGIAKWNTATSGPWADLVPGNSPVSVRPTIASTAVNPTLAPTKNPERTAVPRNTFDIMTITVYGVVALGFLIAIAAFVARVLSMPRSTTLVVLVLAALAGGAAIVSGVYIMSQSESTNTPSTQAGVLATSSPTADGIGSTVQSTPAGLSSPVPAASATMTRPLLAPSATRVEASRTPSLAAAARTLTPLAETRTPTVQATPTATASSTVQPTVAPRYPSVVLREPKSEQQVIGESVTFEWQDLGNLPNGDHYELWLKRVGSQGWERGFRVAGGKFTLYVRDAMGYTDYIWSILITDAQQHVVSQAGEQRKLTWAQRGPSEPPSSGPPPPPPPIIK